MFPRPDGTATGCPPPLTPSPSPPVAAAGPHTRGMLAVRFFRQVGMEGLRRNKRARTDGRRLRVKCLLAHLLLERLSLVVVVDLDLREFDDFPRVFVCVGVANTWRMRPPL